MVYGEILSTFLYRVAENILIRFPTNTFKVYNADTGKWVTSLKIPYIASQDLRTWHIRAAAGEPPSGAVSIGYVD